MNLFFSNTGVGVDVQRLTLLWEAPSCVSLWGPLGSTMRLGREWFFWIYNISTQRLTIVLSNVPQATAHPHATPTYNTTSNPSLKGIQNNDLTIFNSVVQIIPTRSALNIAWKNICMHGNQWWRSKNTPLSACAHTSVMTTFYNFVPPMLSWSWCLCTHIW